MSPSFADLGVPAEIVSALAAHGIDAPFPIQADAIGPALAGRDVCGKAPTGSGKTLAFGIPLLVGLTPATKRRPTALVLAPTRELADQISTELRMIGKPLRTSVTTVYGGVGYGKQKSALQKGVDVVVACPGRLEDLLGEGVLTLDDVERVVLDEADRMADMGFMPAVKRILDQCRRDRQTLLFSATLDGAVGELQRRYQRDPVGVEVVDHRAEPDLDHIVRPVRREDRINTLADEIRAHGSTIVFCRTKRGADRVAQQLGKRKVKAAAIHGDRSQNQRTRALDEFTRGKAVALVATDVAARGIHVDDVACVIHYDPPGDAATYVHRSGRTGRAGATGTVVSFILDKEQRKEAATMFGELKIRPRIHEGPGTTASEPAQRPRETPAPTPTPTPTPTIASGSALQGSVKFFDPRRGFGFIDHGGTDVFVHKSNVEGRIREGQQVRFEIGPGPKGDEAKAVAVLSGR